MNEVFYNVCQKYSEKPSLYVQREGKVLMWTWGQYWKNAVNFAKACIKIGVTERSTIAIMGFNSPEWVFAFFGSFLGNYIQTGIYMNNE
jgi:long-chain-fatty-acid--CoA ligase ACSBG